MTKEILLILACVPLYVVNSFCDKYVSSRNGNRSVFLYNAIKFLIGSLCLIPLLVLDSAPKLRLGAILCGVACGVMYAVSKTVILKGYEKTSVAFMTLCHAAGMLLPCVLGHFLWSEPLDLLALVGILLAVTSIVLLKGGKEEHGRLDAAGILIGLIVFLMSGGIMVVQKLMGLYFSEQSVGAYNLYSFVVACLLLCPFVRPRAVARGEIKGVVLCATGSAVSLGVISTVMTSLAGAVPSAVLFPLYNGLGILCVCIGSVFAFHEKLTPKKIVGLILGVVGLCLVNL